MDVLSLAKLQPQCAALYLIMALEVNYPLLTAIAKVLLRHTQCIAVNKGQSLPDKRFMPIYLYFICVQPFACQPNLTQITNWSQFYYRSQTSLDKGFFSAHFMNRWFQSVVKKFWSRDNIFCDSAVSKILILWRYFLLLSPKRKMRNDVDSM